MEARNSNEDKKNWIDPFTYAGIERPNLYYDYESDSDLTEPSPHKRSFEIASKEDKRNLRDILEANKSKNENRTGRKSFIRSATTFGFMVAIGSILWCMLPYLTNDDSNISPTEMKARLKSLQRTLHTKVHGQHIAVTSVFNSISSHVMDSKPEKPLVLSFHGGVGTGKTFVAEIVAENLYKGGLRNKCVKSYLGPKHFYTEPDNIGKTKCKLLEIVESSVSACPRSLFIFDEADKMVPGVLNGVSPFLGYSKNIDGIDYTKSIFIFLSNTRASDINNLAYEHLRRNKRRQELGILHFSNMIANGAFNDQGGLFKSEMILQRNVNHFVPFLPLERKHILACIKDYLDRKEIYYVDPETIVSLKNFFPEHDEILAEAGCKNIGSMVEVYNPQNRNFLVDEYVIEGEEEER